MSQREPQVDPNTCLELALEGERLCKSGDFTAGVAFLEAAVRIGTDDARVLSAVYSQLGNAYFYLSDYDKALRFHELDLKIVKAQKDGLGEAKASGNLGNTLKMLGRFEEAIKHCERHLLISKAENDKIGEGRAYYNLGNVYHSQGKSLAKETKQDPGDYPLDVRVCLHKAVECYERNLDTMVKLGDRIAQGRAYGNLGNTHYLLGNFRKAITFHEQRLKFAIEFRDRAAERRAYSNLGNCHVFLGEFSKAAECYKKTLELAQQLNDKVVEAQACYSLGNIYTLIGDLAIALDFHMQHFIIARDLKDSFGECRAYLSLANCHQGLGDMERALDFATQHLELAQKIGDQDERSCAQDVLKGITEALGRPLPVPTRRRSMQDMSLVQMTPESRDSSRSQKENGDASNRQNKENNFLEALVKQQANRMDDQRCQIAPQSGNKETASTSTTSTASGTRAVRDEIPQGERRVCEDLLDLIQGIQGRRMDEQRSSLPMNPQTLTRNNNNSQVVPNRMLNTTEDFFEVLARCQSSRLEEQRYRMPEHESVSLSSTDSEPRLTASVSKRKSTVPDEDFLSLIMRAQEDRIEDQRTALQPIKANDKTKTRKVDENPLPLKRTKQQKEKSSFKGNLKHALKAVGRNVKPVNINPDRLKKFVSTDSSLPSSSTSASSLPEGDTEPLKP